MIDFQKLAGGIPKDGILKLVFTKKDDLMTVLVALQFSGKEDNEHFAPMVLNGTAEELTEAFTRDLTELARLSETLYEQLKARPSSVTASKKVAVTKAIAGTASRDQKDKPEMKALPKTAPPALDDLFTVRQKALEPPSSPGTETPGYSEEGETDDETRVVSGGAS